MQKFVNLTRKKSEGKGGKGTRLRRQRAQRVESVLQTAFGVNARLSGGAKAPGRRSKSALA